MKIIPYGRQCIDAQDIKFTSKALNEDLITTGKYVEKFENEIIKLLKVKFAVSCNSGTSAIHLALLSIHVKKDDIVIMPSINFIAAYNISRSMGAKIFLTDVDSVTGQMTPEKLLECIKKNKLKKIKVIITMYLGGYPEHVEDFFKIKKKFKCFLIEDACHSLGAKYNYKNRNLFIGSCQHSDIATFSLHPLKTITSGEGGILTTNNYKIAKNAKLYRSHGIKRKNLWNYEVLFPGFNYRLSDLNCALALSQLKKIQKFISYRKKVYLFYKKNFSSLKEYFNIPKYSSSIKPSYHLFLINFKNNRKIFFSKNFIFKKLYKHKITLQHHYKPIFFFKKIFSRKYLKNDFKDAIHYYKSTLSIPIFVGLSSSQQLLIIKLFKSIFLKKDISIK